MDATNAVLIVSSLLSAPDANQAPPPPAAAPTRPIVHWSDRVPDDRLLAVLDFWTRQGAEMMNSVRFGPPDAQRFKNAGRALSDEHNDTITRLGALLRSRSAELSRTWQDHEMQKIAEVSAEDWNMERAKEFVKELERRAKGRFPDEIGDILFSFSKRFQLEPEAEMRSGFQQIHRAEVPGDGPAFRLGLAHPISWTRLDVEEPACLGAFRSNGGFGDELATVTCIGTAPVDDDRLMQLRAVLKQSIESGQAEFTIFTTGDGVLFGEPAVWAIASRITKVSNVWFAHYEWRWMTEHKGRFIAPSCSVLIGARQRDSLPSDNEMAIRFNRMKGVFEQILTSMRDLSEQDEDR